MRTLFWSNLETIGYLKKELRAGEVFLVEGDTVLGLLADVSEKGVAQLDHIKGRSKKPYLILVGSKEKALRFIEKSSIDKIQTEKLMNACWPGPVTLIFQAKKMLDPHIKSSNGTIALRIPDHAGLLRLLENFNGLFSTSAPVPTTIEAVDSSIMCAVSGIVLNEGNEREQIALPSTIIDCTGERLVVVRHGAFDVSAFVGIMD